MSKLSTLRDALQKLYDAETALFHARKNYHYITDEYRMIDNQFEMVGDASMIIRHILEREEKELISSQSVNLNAQT